MTEEELHGIFSKNVKRYRKDCGWSQVLLAKKAGVSINFLNDLETGKKWASPKTMVKLAEILNIAVYELLRPPAAFPDNVSGIIKRYTDDMHAAADTICRNFLQEAEAAAAHHSEKPEA